MRKFPITIFLTPFLIIAVAMLVQSQVRAQVVTHQQLAIDTSLVRQDEAYSVPTSIVVVPIFPPTTDFNVRDRDWYRGLHYFLTANERRPGFTDVPFHYVVSSDGRVFKGNSGGEERKISIEGLGDQQVVIGYLAVKNISSFDPRSKSVLGEIVMDVASRNSIKLEDIAVAGVDYVRNDDTQTVSLRKSDLFGLWQRSLAEVVEASRPLYSPKPKEYRVEVINVTLPTDQVNPGETVQGSITLRNTGDFGIYGGTISELIATKANGASLFYSPSSWATNSQFPLMQLEDKLLPRSEATFTFKLRVPLQFGQVQESFTIGNVNGQSLPSSEFGIVLNIARPEGVIVEVLPTETGWLRVRSQPSGAATEIARLSTGERYFQIEDAGNGWVKLNLGEGREGWVSRQYLSYL